MLAPASCGGLLRPAVREPGIGTYHGRTGQPGDPMSGRAWLTAILVEMHQR